MPTRITDPNRRKEIIDTCLKTFIENGLLKTSSRDLSKALNMQSSGLYYYFSSKDDIVVACAEEAGIQMEHALIEPVLKSLEEQGAFPDMATLNIKEMAPMMHFFIQVCTTRIYRESMQPVLKRLKKRHSEYAVRFSQKLACKPEELAPYLYSCVAVATNYMLFGEELYYEQPLQLLTETVRVFNTNHDGL